MKKTLGGDRLGAGKKMQVELHGYGRSTHDLGYLWRSTMSAGTIVPFLCEVALPGDTFDIHLDSDVKTHPTIAPLFGSFKEQVDIFIAPIRLYQGQLHNNKLGIGKNMANVKLPTLSLFASKPSLADIVVINSEFDADNVQINPSSIMSYLGIRGIGNSTASPGFGVFRTFNAVPLLMYWDVYKNYYANKQEEIGAVIHGTRTAEHTATGVEVGGLTIPAWPSGGVITIGGLGTNYDTNLTFATPPSLNWANNFYFITSIGNISANEFVKNGYWIISGNELQGQYDAQKYGVIQVYAYNYTNGAYNNPMPPEVVTFPLENIDDMREYLLSQATAGAAAVAIGSANKIPYTYVEQYDNVAGEWIALQNTQEGLAVKTYQSDMFNNWLSTEWIDGVGGINDITAIDTSGGSFNIDTLNLSKKVYEMLNRIAVSGGSYDDWLDAVYTHDRITRTESPIYMGGLSKELVFQEVVSNAQSGGESTSQPLGTLAGKGVMSKKHKGGSVTIRVDEPSYIMGLVSLTPRLDYSQGNKWDVNLTTLDDLHKPHLDEIGFQELIIEQMHWATTEWDATDGWVQKSAGKQPAWLNYMTNVNQVRGNFAIRDNQGFMVLTRRYELDSNFDINDLTTYIDPIKFNHIFAQTSIDAQNFWVQIAVDITARRKMSAKVMPNL